METIVKQDKELNKDIKTFLYQLPVCTAFTFVYAPEYARDAYPYVTSSIISDRPKRVLCFSLETGKEYYISEDLIVEVCLKFSFKNMYGHLFWLHGKTSSIVLSMNQDELGKFKSFTVGCGKNIIIAIPTYAECIIEN